MSRTEGLLFPSFYEDIAIFPIGEKLTTPVRNISIPLTALIFMICTGLVLFLDSAFVASFTYYGQLLAALVATVYLLWLLWSLDIKWLLPTILFLPLSYLGEALFSLVLGYYHYRLGFIPAYVPIGHSILMCVAAMLMAQVTTHQKQLLWVNWMTGFHIALILGALIFFKDTFSFVYAIPFFLLLPYRKRFTLFALFIGLLVLYVEIVGTWMGAWHWISSPGGLLHTVNPPVGAFVFYVIGKLVAVNMAEGSGLIKSASEPI